ncbi:DUF3304 domain-containing protein [Massilia sp. Leaf139]|uniref:DUF3304 domain-containing protein n=1 Tax=Massilia sp. Leaf139 TaxID=1736272 RepID=UPI0009E9B3FB|nr:DUF3304 domain-containing protein [Massilia sp. Leaf139]
MNHKSLSRKILRHQIINRISLFGMVFFTAAGYALENNVDINDILKIDNSNAIDIVGFNYTDQIIDSFSINGQGGGNIFLSNRTSGGGKSACCLVLSGAKKESLRIHVRWQSGGCLYITKSRISGEVFKNIFAYYKEAYVDVLHPKNHSPEHLEVHFYPDGSVRAELTNELSLPRIALNGKRNQKTNLPRCRDDKKPE